MSMSCGLGRRNITANEDGTVAVSFGLLLTAFLAFGGISIDQTRAYIVQADLQSAIDASALAAARQKIKDADVDPRPAFDAQLTANWGAKAASGAPVINEFSVVSGQIHVKASTRMPTYFMSILGHSEVDIHTASTVQYGTGELEIALVLDNTFSMNGSKLSTLKEAATGLVDTLKPDGDSTDHVKVSVVPFAQYVNVGLHNRSQNWISVPDDYSISGETCSMVSPVISKTGCSMQTMTGYNDGVPYTYQKVVCINIEYGPAEEQCSTNTTNYVWSGCVGSRDNPLDIQDGSYTPDPIIGLMNTSCPSAISSLSSVKSQVLDQIDAMVATGNTYIPSGLMWGWRSLSRIEPFAEGAASGTSSVQKVLVLMTDGANTKSATYPQHNGSDAVSANALTTSACNSIKAADIMIFTITFDATDNDIKDIMRDCASSSENYYDAANSSELIASFEAIVQSLTHIRIAG
ncbi:MAG: pilus assembly protein TadG-related protein [Hyphomicrobiaceae bacterium]